MNEKHFHPKDNDLKELLALFEDNLYNDYVSFLTEEEYERLIEYYEFNGDFDKAFAAIHQATEVFPFSGNFYVREAQIQIQRKKLEKAKEAYEKARLYEPNSPDVMLLLADIKLAELKYEEALTAYKALLNVVDEGDKADVYLEIADVYEQMHDFESLGLWLKQCLRFSPDNEEALNRYWNFIDDAGRYEEAIDFHKELLNVNPYNYLAWNNLGNAYEESGFYEKAIDAYEYATAINDDYYYVYWDLAACLCKVEQWDKARQIFSEIGELFNQKPQISIEIGKCDLNEGRFEVARKHFRSAMGEVKGNQATANCYYLIGKSYEKESNFRQAIFYYKRALEFNSDKVKYWNSLGKLQFEVEEYIEAAGCFIKAIALNEHKVTYWIYLAKCYYTLDMSEMLFNVLDRGIETNPGNAKLIYTKSAFLLKAGKNLEGLNQLSEAINLSPKLKSSIFALFPELENQQEIIDLLKQYQE